MKAIVTGVTFSLGIAFAAHGAETGSPIVLEPRGSEVAIAGYKVELGDADDPKAPRAWQGPLRITRPSGTTCIASDDVSIIERPLSLVQDYLLYVSTYSGSESTLFVVDANDCAARWTSPNYVGTADLTAVAIRLPGHAALKIGVDGLPAARVGRKARWKRVVQH